MKVIKVKTIDQWNEVLKVLFDQGNDWRGKGGHDLTTHPDIFINYGARYLYVENGEITHGSIKVRDKRIISAEKFLKEKISPAIVLVENIRQWDNVLDKFFAAGHKWPSGETEYKHHLWKCDQDNILGLTRDGNINIMNKTNKKYSTYDEFMGEKIYTVTKREMETLETVKNHAGLNLMAAVSAWHVELSKINSIGNGAILRWLGGDDKISIVVEEPKWRLTAIDKDGDKAYVWVNKYGIQGSTSIEALALIGSKEELAKYKSDFWLWEEVDD